jgi:hypothetical protein
VVVGHRQQHIGRRRAGCGEHRPSDQLFVADEDGCSAVADADDALAEQMKRYSGSAEGPPPANRDWNPLEK